MSDQWENPLVSLVVVTYNSANLLPQFFAALAHTTYRPYEVIVVDNASSDGTQAYLAREQPDVRLVACPENVGFGRACNIGAAVARGEIVVFLNPDVWAMPGWLDTLVRCSAAHPDALMCPTTLHPDQRPEQHAIAISQEAAVPACALLVRKHVWQQLGGFDERFFLYWEDTELCWRAWLLGYRVLADLETFVYHERGGSTGGSNWDGERTKNSLRTYLKLMRWRRVLPFVVTLAAKTAVKYVRSRDGALLEAWRWNWRMLGETLAERRSIERRRKGDYAALERLIDAHEKRMRQERRDR